MPTLLQIDCSPQKRYCSISRQLTAAGADAWLRRYPDGQVIRRDLQTTPLTLLGQDWIDGADLTPELRTEEQGFTLLQSERLADELIGATVVLIGASMHNLTLPASLRLWLDHVILPNRTVAFQPAGAVGLLPDLKVIVIVSNEGENRSAAQAEALKLEFEYLQFVFRSLGVRDVTMLPVIGANQVRSGKVALDEFLQPWREHLDLLFAGKYQFEPADGFAMRRTA